MPFTLLPNFITQFLLPPSAVSPLIFIFISARLFLFPPTIRGFLQGYIYISAYSHTTYLPISTPDQHLGRINSRHRLLQHRSVWPTITNPRGSRKSNLSSL
ncbi:hypothetical protein BDW75DRAFT_101996 [Aspergillus navahoensis]